MHSTLLFRRDILEKFWWKLHIDRTKDVKKYSVTVTYHRNFLQLSAVPYRISFDAGQSLRPPRGWTYSAM